MLIAVGMYLPFETTFAIFVGGVFKWILDKIVEKRKMSKQDKELVDNKGILLASGFIAGEALTGVLLAGLVLLGIPSLTEHFFGVEELSILNSAGGWLSLIIFGIIAFAFIVIPLRKKAV
ncbi:MAG: hypothetical protein COS89_02875 [Deltaproteobacteria bacterium CG07_land_8_20_14_0_80_38_7]|nr:MAG: hypothetical protein COS89_02875 [Deltaproteobacteria bacterium CG07_land_8_20_14_0_80_38_7]